MPISIEVKLWNEKLEKGYVRDIISPHYEFQKLIPQFKTLAFTLEDTVPSIELFACTYKMECLATINRLVISGVPAIVEHRVAAATNTSTSAAIVAECVQNFITSMDSLKLNTVAVDRVHPWLSDLCGSRRSCSSRGK
ncbi:putative vacuolar protein sorting-associated, VPS28 [Lupinus albus]|uniref:Putative vacuolar protein sorting-associated, VPS28 n=1 Tax=Lupinus albus TaxID=3870 RepID=A0A6A4PZG0_LUPAL|nr:putative vacuolar protein sorting-associated, VPS28 [Lupinus albus]